MEKQINPKPLDRSAFIAGSTSNIIDESNPVIQDIMNNNYTINPNYNPKTKKGKLEPKYIQIDPRDFRGGLGYDFSNVANQIRWTDRDTEFTPEEIKDYIESGVAINKDTTRKEADLIRANNQSNWKKTGNMLVQAGLNEVVLGAMLGISNTVDMILNLGKDKGEDDYTNPISKAIEDLQEKVRKDFAIYQRNPGESFDVGDWGWWTNNAVSIASSASMAIPSYGIVSILSKLGKIKSVGRAANALAKMGKGVSKVKAKDVLKSPFSKASREAAKFQYLEGSKRFGTFRKALDFNTKVGSNVLLSRTMENYQEARGVYNEVYESSLNRINNMSDSEKDSLIKRNPSFKDKSNEEIASYIASCSADETFANDYAMLLFDFVQFKSVSSLFKGVKSNVASGNLHIINRNAARSLNNATRETLEKTGWLYGKKEAIKRALSNPISSIAAVEWSEGIEEGYQGIQTEKGKELAELIFNPKFRERTLESYLIDDSILEQAFWGVLGGVGFQGIMTGFGNAKNRVKGLYNKFTMSKEDYEKTKLTNEKIRELEINARQVRMQSFINAMKLLNEGKDPTKVKKDKDGNVIIKDGNKEYGSITKEDADLMKQNVIDDFIEDLALDAANAGNFDLLKDYLSDSQISKFFKDAGVDVTPSDKDLQNYLLDRMDHVVDVYNSELANIFDAVDIEDHNIANLAARNITRHRLYREGLNERLNTNLSKQENELNNTDSNIIDEAINKARRKYIFEELNKLDAAENSLFKDVNKGLISKQAANEYKKSYNRRCKQLIDYARQYDSEIINGSLKGTFSNIENNAINDDIKTSNFIEEYRNFVEQLDYGYITMPNNFIDENLNNDGSVSPVLQKLIDDQIKLEDGMHNEDYNAPKNAKDYEKIYKELDEDNSDIARKRFEEATDKIGEWIQNHENPIKAFNDAIEGNVPEELKKYLDIIKIGHHSTKEFTSLLIHIANEEVKKRNKNKEENEKVKVDGETLTEEKAEKKKEEIKEVIENTDKREEEKNENNEYSPFTGDNESKTEKHIEPINRDEILNSDEIIPVDKREIEELTNEADKATEEILKKQQDEFALTVNEKAIGLGCTISIELFKSSPNLFNDLIGKDTNSEEFNKLVELVAKRLEEEGVSKSYSLYAAKKGVGQTLNMLSRRSKRQGQESKADSFKNLADEIASKAKIEIDENGKFSIANTIEGNELNETIDKFIESYIKYKDISTIKGQKTIINLERLFKELIEDNEIGINQALYIFYNIKDYIKNSDKYTFTHKREFNKSLKNPNMFFAMAKEARNIEEQVDNYMHIAATKYSNDFYSELDNIINGASINIDYVKLTGGDIGDTSMVFTVNGKQIGYVATVNKNNQNNEYTLRKQHKGFKFTVRKNANGTYSSNLDELFINIIKGNGEEYAYIKSLLRKFHNNKIDINNASLTKEELISLLNTEVIRKLLNNGLILFPKKRIFDDESKHYHYEDTLTDSGKAEMILNELNNIIYFDPFSQSNTEYIVSFKQFITNMYKNYENTHKIELALKQNGKVSVKLAGFNTNNDNNNVLITEDNRGINSIGLDSKNNPVLVVMNDGNSSYIINEQTGEKYENTAGFMVGTMGFMIKNNPNAPIMALITESNKVSSNKKMAGLLHKEITDILTKFQNKEITFDEVYERLGELFCGPGLNPGTLFGGFSVVKYDDSILLNIGNKEGSYNLIIHKNKKNKNETGTGITYIPNGDQSKAVSSISVNKNFIEVIANEIVENAIFNKTFYSAKNVKNDNEKSNRYLYKENGKLVVEVGGVKTEYDNFGQFALETNAFNTNQATNSRGGFFDESGALNSLYIDVSTTTVPEIEKIDENATKETVKELIKNSKKGNSTKQLLQEAQVDEQIIEVITGNNEFEIKLVEDRFYYDPKLTKAKAKYSNGKLYFSSVGAIAAQKNKNNLIRLLIHETLHKRINDNKLLARKEVINELYDVYDLLLSAIDNDINTLDKNSDKYKQAKRIKNWITTYKFNPIDYFTTGSKQQNAKWSSMSEEDRREIFIEEFLVESLTQKELINYMNNTNLNTIPGYSDGDVIVDNIENENKSIWQKIIDILLKIFGKYRNDIKNNTILAKEYLILGNINNEINQQQTDNINEENTENTKNTKNEENIEEDLGYLYKENTNIDEKFDENKYDDYESLSIPDTINESFDEIRINTFNDNPSINPNGLSLINDMNDYINSYSEQDRPLIASMIENGTLKYVCR